MEKSLDKTHVQWLPSSLFLRCTGDPGHDDAIALLVALYASNSNGSQAFELLGVSTVGGNAPVKCSFINAARLLVFFKAPLPDSTSNHPGPALFIGAREPLIKPARHDAGIHGDDGLGGVIGLPSGTDVEVKRRMWTSTENGPLSDAELDTMTNRIFPRDPSQLLLHWYNLLTSRIRANLPKMTLIATGPLTNVALLLKSYPTLVEVGVEQIVIMGGSAFGAPGNRGPLAEFNILVDPEAAQIVFQHDIKVVMAGLNVTHQAIFTQAMRDRLLSQGPAPTTQPSFRQTIASILDFFAETYKTEFGFHDGPPVHDMLAVLYVLDSTLFYLQDKNKEGQPRSIPPKRYRVDVECNAGSLALGATVVDVHDDHKSSEHEDYWGRGSKNVVVLEEVDTERVWQIFNDCVDRAERAVLEA